MRHYWEKLKSSSSSKLKLLTILLLLVSGILVLLDPKTSNWVFFPSHHNRPSLQFSAHSRSLSQSQPLSASTTTSDGGNSSAVKSKTNEEARLDLQSATRSPPPPQAESTAEEPPAGKRAAGLTVTRNGPQVIPSTKVSKLERLEAGLVQARAAIKAAKIANNGTHDDSNQPEDQYIPRGAVYRNADAFLRSYLEMEKQMKVYVYEEGEPPVFHYGLSKGILGLEGIFIHQMEISPFRTRDPDQAHLFFLPFSVISLTNFVYVVDSHLWEPMRDTVRDYVNLVATKYPYWNRSGGADHFMLACHDWAPHISFGIPNLYKNSIRALCNANTSERFNPSRDVSIPEIYLPEGTTTGLLGGPPPSNRSILVFYAGGVHGPIRPILLEHWENKDPDVQVHKYLPQGVSYYGMIRKSMFCICPSGYEVASPRMVEALYMGCVPVLIKDYYVAPFSDVLDWKTFAVEIPVRDIPNMKKILKSISWKKYLSMQRRGLQVRRHFEVNFPPKRFDVFHMMLHSIWLRRLNIRVEES
ncbi:Xylogalacturonan beta-1,3-xylosyltransferase [Bertholletia excelsa]